MNIFIIGVLEGEERENWAIRIFEELKAETSQILQMHEITHQTISMISNKDEHKETLTETHDRFVKRQKNFERSKRAITHI